MPLCNKNTRPFLQFTTGFTAMMLICISTSSQTFSVDTLMRNGSRANRINLVYLSDGYQSDELTKFISNAVSMNNALFSQTPFLQYKNFFNAFAVRVPSVDSAASHPGTASDEATSGGQPVKTVNTYFQSTFDFASIHRLLVAQNATRINNVLASNVPDYDQAFVIVNSPYYGGSGGSVATSSINIQSPEVAIHEIGHSFAGLADEYWAGPQYAAEKPNMTQTNDPATVKWKAWYGRNNISIIPYGTTAPLSTWYKPHPSCKMQFLGVPFCSVCAEAIVTRIHSLTSMIDSVSPAASVTLTSNDSVKFSVKPVRVLPAQQVFWRINGTSFPASVTDTSITVPYAAFDFSNQANAAVSVEIRDVTGLTNGAFIEQFTWTVTNATLPVHITNFSGKISNGSALLDWNIENIEDALFFELEKSNDGTSFSKLAVVNPLPGEKKYTYSDQRMLSNVAFYRLKVVEKNNSVHYSNVIQLQNTADKFYYKVYQNADLHLYHLRCAFAEDNKNVSVKVFNANGSVVLNRDFGKVSRQLDYDIDLSNKPGGVYFLQIIINNQIYTAQLIAR